MGVRATINGIGKRSGHRGSLTVTIVFSGTVYLADHAANRLTDHLGNQFTWT